MPSNFKIGDEQRRSGGYACGKCGAKPKFGHICPFKNIDADDAITPPSLDPLVPTTSIAEQSTAESAALEAITTAQKIITEQQANNSEEELVEKLQSESADAISISTCPSRIMRFS